MSEHNDNLCRDYQFKLHALGRIKKIIMIVKAKILGNLFIESRFDYAPLIWMFCRKLKLKIEKNDHKTLKDKDLFLLTWYVILDYDFE